MSNRQTRAGFEKSHWPAAMALVVAAGLSACANPPSKSAPPAAPPVTSLEDYLQQASQTVADGARDKARETYRTAARSYPASKLPWSKLSEDYFVAGDYGNAILAAQEVLQRDPNDTMATSVLAVSGLRVSAVSLQKLRAQNRVAGDARSEAETMTQTLREVLGEDVLVPRAGAANAGAKRRAAVRPVQAAKPVEPAPKVGAAPGNPFDKFK